MPIEIVGLLWAIVLILVVFLSIAYWPKKKKHMTNQEIRQRAEEIYAENTRYIEKTELELAKLKAVRLRIEESLQKFGCTVPKKSQPDSLELMTMGRNYYADRCEYYEKIFAEMRQVLPDSKLFQKYTELLTQAATKPTPKEENGK